MNLKPNDSFDIYSDGRFYDLENARHRSDLPFYLEQAKLHGGPILELACGTGRIAIPIAEEGFEITGLDISRPMLNQARCKADRAGIKVEWLEGDCRNFSLGRKFKLVFFPFNAIAHIHDLESHEALFDRISEHLEADGRFVFDWLNPKFEFLMRDPSRRYPCFGYDDPDGGGKVIVKESNVYDSATQINHIKWYYRIGLGDEVVRELNMRLFYPKELDALLHYNGFEIEAKYGDFDMAPFVSSSRHQVLVCRRR